jgi:hypothetical protein
MSIRGKQIVNISLSVPRVSHGNLRSKSAPGCYWPDMALTAARQVASA